MEKFYFANEGQRTVGIINLNESKGLISNIGVDPAMRGKGYGRQMMLFGLDQLKRSGCKEAYLRVHVNNTPAIRLYESLGFVRSGRYKTLIWRRTS
jgi:ribosomal protein S18 acetylase RimI-like enzyme